MAILKDLIVHGSSRFLNKIYASEIQTPLIEAEAGIIKKLKADDATVVGLLDVKGQLHTSSWSNSNIATIDGSFYITPTIGSDSGTVSITSSSLTFSGTNYAVSSLYLGDGSSINWPQYSKVLVTGQILLNGEWIPLGTLLGQLSNAATATSITINNIKDNKKPPSNISNVYTTLVNSGVSSTDYRNLKISLYQRAAGQTDFRPLGIYMTATGTNGKTFLDIYGGVELLNNNINNNNNYGGFAIPNVRIGNLQGLPNVGGQTPRGWGIYTDNGYFKGIIAADQGYIGSGSKYWVIANEEDLSNSENSRSYIYNGTNNIASTVEGVYLGTDGIRNYKDSTHYVTIKNGVISALGADLSGKIIASSGSIGGWNIGTDTNKSLYHGNQTPGATTTNLVLSSSSATNSNAIGGSATGLNWFLSAGKVFGVTTAGALYATSGKIGGFDIGITYIKNGKTSYNETTNDGVYLGTDGIGLGKGSFYVTKAGSLTAKSGSIGGWQLDANSFHTGTWGDDNSALICTGTGGSKSIGGSESINNWVFTAGANFGVTKSGALYANSANISGKIIATQGTIGGINIVNGALDVSSINIGDLSGEIGGRNLIINTLNPDATAANRPKIFGQTVDTGGRGTASVAEHGIRFTTTSDAYCYIYMGLTSITSGSGATLQGLTPGKTYTFSCDFSCKLFSADTSTTIRHLRFTLYDDTSGSFAVDGEHQNMIDLDASKKGVEQSGNFSYTFTLPANITKLGFVIRSNVTTNTLFLTGDFIELRNIKLEEGNKATKWSPAYEDITVTSYITKIDDTGIKITPYDKSGNNYLQINSDAISMYRNNIKTLEIGDSDIKFYDGQIEGLEIASFGGANGVRIGNEKETHFVINNSAVKTLNNNGSTIFSIETTDTQIGNTIKIASGGIVPSEGYSITLDTNSFSLSTGDEIYIEQITLNLKVTGSFSQTLSFQNFQVNQNPQTITLLGKTSQGPPHPSTTGRFLSYLSTSSNVFKYGTASTISYNLSGNLVNDYSDDHPYSGQIKITYNGNNTFTFNSIIDSSSFNDSGFVLEPDSQYSYSDIMVKNKTSYAPALTFGTRLGTVGPLSTVIGEALYAPGRDQMTIGKFNYGEDTQVSPYSFVVGNGRDDIYRSNAFTIDQNGNVGIQGKIHNIIISEGTETKLPLFHFEGKTWTIGSIRANGAWYCEDNNPDINVAGYTPVAIAGYSVWGGTNGSWCVVPRVYIDQHGTDTWGNPTPAKLQGYVWNQGSQAATNIKFTVEILYIANNFID